MDFRIGNQTRFYVANAGSRFDTNLSIVREGADGDAILTIEADSDNLTESSNPVLRFYQDGQAIGLNMGLTGAADQDALGNTFTGAGNNSFVINFDVTTSATDRIYIGRGAPAIEFTNTNDVVIHGNADPDVTSTTDLGTASKVWRRLYTDNVYFGADVGYLREVTGSYGSVEAIGAAGSSGTWSGYNIGGEAVFMSNLTGSTTTNRFGLYDDLNNAWAVQCNASAANHEVVLYCDSNAGTNFAAFTTKAYNTTGNTSAAAVKDRTNSYRDVGFNVLVDQTTNASDTLEAKHCGAMIASDNASTYTLTLEASTSSDFPDHGVTTILNAGTGDINVNEGTGTTLYYVEPGTGRVDTTGGAVVGPGGLATLWRATAAIYYIWGSEITYTP
jgi:hypothetical protein